MSSRRLLVTDDVHRYIIDHPVREPEVLARLRAITLLPSDFHRRFLRTRL